MVVTDSVGRKSKIQFRLADRAAAVAADVAVAAAAAVRGGDDRGVIDPAEPLMLHAVNTETMASGFYRDQLGVDEGAGEGRHGRPRLRHADQGRERRRVHGHEEHVRRRSRISGSVRRSRSSRKISDANPQQKDYNWGTAELVHWTSADGIAAQGHSLQAGELRSEARSIR